MIDEMHRSMIYWLCASYKKNEPNISKLASDATPAEELAAQIRRLARRWLRRFNQLAPNLANYFSQSVDKRNELVLKRILRDGGFSVRFQKTPAMQDIMQAIVHENVSLIKSIPQQYLRNVETVVMQSVQTGRDLKQLTDDLQKQFNVMKRRATLIARDQNNKATAYLHRARMLEHGINEAIWMHSGGGQHPRRTHVKAGRDRVKFDLAKGWFDPDPKVQKYILPGQLINCRCVYRPVVAGFS